MPKPLQVLSGEEKYINKDSANGPRSKKYIYGFLRTNETSLGQVQDCCKSGKCERKYWKMWQSGVQIPARESDVQTDIQEM